MEQKRGYAGKCIDTAFREINEGAEMNIEAASSQLDEFIASVEKKCSDDGMDLRIENGDIYVYMFFYEADGEFTHIKRIINTAPF